ncbi:MAG: leucyl/phenylalanyl-tRNA--protein transferase [Pseudoxanthomonas suwonensis]|nr:leucyl/phenylalanyl-tRNA--protein transferase [Pseudoxanthomonas suwonensis]
MQLTWLDPDPRAAFPPVASALREPDGLLAAGGDLSVPRLLNAYAHGIFPWYSDNQPILWWSPDPRMVFDTSRIHLASRFRRQLRRSRWRLRADTAFATVINACARAPRPGQGGTWITSAMRDAYVALHEAGHAHSVEVFDDDVLVGGIYGVAVGRMFYGESMVSLASGGSKVALAGLAGFLQEREWPLIDAQVESAHLSGLGARLLPRAAFLRQVASLVALPGIVGSWSAEFGQRPASALAADRA